MDIERIRNFSIVAHIDHGKSTLADRLLLRCGAVSEREMRDQFLDDMDLEREKGITIKANRASLDYDYAPPADAPPDPHALRQPAAGRYMLNLIDTPGHVDFHYEVSRALAACDGALLLVDATQGIEAQTLANAYKAVEAGLTILPVINKIDLPSARPEDVALELEHVIGLPADSAMFVSAKTGDGVDELLRAIVERIPPPTGDPDAKLKALIYDAKADPHRGVVCHVRVVDGRMMRHEKIDLMRIGRTYQISDVGKFRPHMTSLPTLEAGDVGYLFASIKTIHDVRIGDTVTHSAHRCEEPLPGYQAPQCMVFCDFYPGPGTTTPQLREAMEKLWLNDSSFSFEPVTSMALGTGFRCGFLGLLHMNIIQERLEREADIDLVQTAPTVGFEIVMSDGSTRRIESPAALPDAGHYQEIREPVIKCDLLVRSQDIGGLMRLAEDRRGTYGKTEYISTERVLLTYEFPLSEVIYDFYDRLKSLSSGYGTMDYEIIGFKAADLVKLNILVNGQPVDALSVIVHRDKAEARGRRLITRLKKEISRHLFEIPLQAAIGGKVIARESIKPVRKDVTAKCYGGDVTRKRKLLEKQKAGKKRMKQVGSVAIPQEAFMAVLDPGD
ncbi:MAG: translation elongation factor 4 [Phycisphaerae bacterium]